MLFAFALCLLVPSCKLSEDALVLLLTFVPNRLGDGTRGKRGGTGKSATNTKPQVTTLSQIGADLNRFVTSCACPCTQPLSLRPRSITI